MNLKAKTFVQDDKNTIQLRLASRLELLQEKGLDQTVIRKDVLIRKLQADIRQANRRLKSIAAQEKLIAGKIQTKKDKLEAALQPIEKPKAAAKKKAGAETPKKKKKAKPEAAASEA